MKKKFIVFELGHEITLTIPEYPMTDEITSAFLLLGGMLYHGLIQSKQDKANFPKMLDE